MNHVERDKETDRTTCHEITSLYLTIVNFQVDSTLTKLVITFRRVVW